MDATERQVAKDLADIRRDHTARYEWVSERAIGSVVDAACGVGYGSYIMAEAGLTVRRFDIDEEAVAHAEAHYDHENIKSTTQADALFVSYRSGLSDAVVAFECIEHIEDPLAALQNFHQTAPRLFASVPNESVWPHLGTYKHHHRHYTPRDFEELLNVAGYEVESWWGQDGKFGAVEPEIQGRTLVVEAVRSDDPKGETYHCLPPAPTRPESVAIVAMGNSKDTYASMLSNAGGNRHAIWDEVWAINAAAGVFRHDKCIAMDDMSVQQTRAEARPEIFIGPMLEWMREHDKPIITCRAYDAYPMTEEYPLEDVLNEVGTPYLNTTVAYAVALAISIGVKKICLYGCDFSYPSLHKREKGRGCVEFLLGIAAARGIAVELAQNTTLMDANEPTDHFHMVNGERVAHAHLYGYDTEHLEVEHTLDNGWKVKHLSKDKLPTADEMELKYAHAPIEEAA